MRSTQQFSVTLPDDMAEMVRAKVSSGHYADEAEVILEALHALQERDAPQDPALETWLRTEVVAAYDELRADPSNALTVEQVRQHLADKRKRSASA